ncbi:sensor histidine kinase [Aquimarina spongiae]|uniref:Histidine kinase n=1 Tax=Aquimarina spongiae TaxID=570521 RepID=A0A1M6ELS7_9FLAO|nr:histidine kinase [Aquimarina spongiae]SHI86349.1 Histidine kinase [Aquimarina spongiae]
MLNWFYKYKIYHLVFWMVYHFAWWSISVGDPVQAIDNILFSPYTTKFVFYVVFQALAVYFNLYYLIPKYLITGRYKIYLFALFLTIMITASFIVSGYYLTPAITGLPFEELFKKPTSAYWDLFKSNALSSTIASMTLAMSIKLGKNWIETRKREQELEKEKIETELKFLRSQFNPHFLFNTINSIFVLIHKNPDKASDSLAKFSDLLRYQLYECNASKISVEQELNYLNNFIELGSLRLDNSVRCDFNLPQATNDQLDIAPFILMPFIENAFKHVSQTHLQDNWISIHITINGSSLYMEVSNSVAQVHNNTDVIKSNGIGLVNVKRRLALIYPDLHVLEISKELDKYKLRLQIQLDTTKELEAYPEVRELSFKVS